MLRCTRLPIRLINHKDWKGEKKRKEKKTIAPSPCSQNLNAWSDGG